MKDLLTLKTYNLIVVDAMNLAARMHYGKRMLSYNGKPTGMIYGVAQFAFKCRSLYPKSRVIFLWEGTNSRRKSMDMSYKASREKDTSFRSLVQELKPFLENMNIDQMYHLGLEADDLAGHIVDTMAPGETALLVSNDEDWFQFLREGRVDLQRHDIIETYSDIQDSLGFPPERIGLWKVLKGDHSDDIKGIKGLPSSAARLLVNRCDSLEKIKRYPLRKHNDRWITWEDTIKNNWDLIKHNAELILFHPEWIEMSQIICIKGKENVPFLKSVLVKNGIKSLLRELEPGESA